jgi:hypothetical protein
MSRPQKEADWFGFGAAGFGYTSEVRVRFGVSCQLGLLGLAGTAGFVRSSQDPNRTDAGFADSLHTAR